MSLNGLVTHGLIICAGLYSSGSTWLFNMITEIERLKSPNLTVAGIYSERLDDKAESDAGGADVTVIKMHIPDAVIRMIAAQSDIPVFLTVRDPHDCVASLMKRFRFSFADATDMVGKSCEALLRLIPRSRPLILKYEDGFTAGVEGIEKIAAHLGRKLSENELRALAERLSPEAVSAFVARLTADGVFDNRRPAGFQYDPATQWHPNHVGDRTIGKYAALLSEAQIALVGDRTRELRVRFGYA